MQTNFSPERLRDPEIGRSNQILRTCVHCGFCTATCPTYQVLGDELVQPGQSSDPLRQPSPGQPPPALVLDLDVVVVLGPVITRNLAEKRLAAVAAQVSQVGFWIIAAQAGVDEPVAVADLRYR